MCLCSFVAFMCLTIKAYQYWGYIGVHMKSLVGKTIGKKVQTGNIDEVSAYLHSVMKLLRPISGNFRSNSTCLPPDLLLVCGSRC